MIMRAASRAQPPLKRREQILRDFELSGLASETTTLTLICGDLLQTRLCRKLTKLRRVMHRRVLLAATRVVRRAKPLADRRFRDDGSTSLDACASNA